MSSVPFRSRVIREYETENKIVGSLRKPYECDIHAAMAAVMVDIGYLARVIVYTLHV